MPGSDDEGAGDVDPWPAAGAGRADGGSVAAPIPGEGSVATTSAGASTTSAGAAATNPGAAATSAGVSTAPGPAILAGWPGGAAAAAIPGDEAVVGTSAGASADAATTPPADARAFGVAPAVARRRPTRNPAQTAVLTTTKPRAVATNATTFVSPSAAARSPRGFTSVCQKRNVTRRSEPSQAQRCVVRSSRPGVPRKASSWAKPFWTATANTTRKNASMPPRSTARPSPVADPAHAVPSVIAQAAPPIAATVPRPTAARRLRRRSSSASTSTSSASGIPIMIPGRSAATREAAVDATAARRFPGRRSRSAATPQRRAMLQQARSSAMPTMPKATAIDRNSHTPVTLNGSHVRSRSENTRP